jgi:hypothetical protein
LYVHLRLAGENGPPQEWRVRCNYLNAFADVAQIYLPVYTPGKYTATVFVGSGSQEQLLVDRIELRDVFGAIPKKAAKTQRMLLSDDQLKRLRAEYAAKNPPKQAAALDAAQRRARNEALWASWPPRNALQGACFDPAADPLKSVLAQLAKERGVANVVDLNPWKPTALDQPWGFANAKTGQTYGLADYEARKPCGEVPCADAGDGAVFRQGSYGAANDVVWAWMAANNEQRLSALYRRMIALAQEYENTGSEAAAWDGAVLLAAFADLYPDLDYRVQLTSMQLGAGGSRNTSFRFNFSGGPFGKIQYCNWESAAWIQYCYAYDQLFDFIKGNRELAEFVGTKVPWVKTPQDIVELIDVNILQHGVDCFNRRQMTAEDEDKAHVAAFIMGPGEAAQWALDSSSFRCVDMRMTNAGGIDDHTFASYTREGTGIIGSLGYSKPDGVIRTADRLERLVRGGADPKYNLGDPDRYPSVVGAALSLFDVYCAGGFAPVQGDSGDPARTRQMPDASRRDVYAAAFRWTRDPRFAYMLAGVCGRAGESDTEWKEITTAAAGLRDPRLDQASRVLGGAGFAFLESGRESDDYRFKRAVALTYVTGVGHAHQDTLHVELFSHGCRLAPDIGGRHEGPNRGVPNMRTNRVHNVVEVDGRNFENVMPGSTTAGTGWVEMMKPLPGAQLLTASARATSHPEVSIYRRTLALVDVDEGKPATKPPSTPVYGIGTKHDPDAVTPNSYVFDVFRVAGGKMHTYCFHGAQSGYRDKEIRDIVTNAPLAPAASESAKTYLGQMGNPREGKAPALLEVTWQLDEQAERSFMTSDFSANGARKFPRLSMLNQAGADFLVGNAYSDHYKYDWPFIFVQRRGEQEPQQTVFASVMEMYAGEPYILSKRMLKVTPAEGGALAPVAVEVKTKNGHSDILYSSGVAGRLTDVEGGFRADGLFACVSRDGDGVRLAEIVGGSQLRAPDMEIEVTAPAYEARVTSVDYAAERLTVDKPFPVALSGEEALVGSPANWTSFTLAEVAPQGQSAALKFTRTGRFYQSPVTFAHDKQNWISCEIPPPFYRADVHYYDNGVAVNESGTQSWRVAKIASTERWMHLGWPGFRGSFPVDVAEKDVTDADGDGKRTLRMYPMEDKEKADVRFGGKDFYALEVSRVDEKQNTFYFKTPADAPWAEESWCYNARKMSNEAGTKTWESRYPGFDFQVHLTGNAPVTAIDDADKDGVRKIRIYRFGVGDTIRIETHAQVRRVEKDLYEVRANAPVRVTLPGKTAFVRAAEGVKTITSKAAGQSVAFELSFADVGNKGIALVATSEDGRTALQEAK